MMKIEVLNPHDLKPMPFRATHTLKPDLSVLATSLFAYGWTSPIIVRKKTMTIIDGHERVSLAAANKELLFEGRGVPATIVDVDEIDAMIMHVAVNRGRGEIVNTRLSKLLRHVHFSRKYGQEDLAKRLGMTEMEFGVLMDGSLLKLRKVQEHTYSRAWVPIESDKDEYPITERPPNPEG